MDTRPLVFIDVDGPLNSYAAKSTRRPEGYTTHRLRPQGWEHAENPLRVWLNPEHGPLLLAFAAEHDAELVWATTWMADANTMIGPEIGLPELPFIDYIAHPGTIKGWKFPATAKYAVGRPLVWFDDDFELHHKARILSNWSETRRGLPTLLHHVDPRIGLTSLDLSQAGRWLKSLKESND